MKDKVAIVGGFGFLGSRLSSRLNKIILIILFMIYLLMKIQSI